MASGVVDHDDVVMAVTLWVHCGYWKEVVLYFWCWLRVVSSCLCLGVSFIALDGALLVSASKFLVLDVIVAVTCYVGLTSSCLLLNLSLQVYDINQNFHNKQQQFGQNPSCSGGS